MIIALWIAIVIIIALIVWCFKMHSDQDTINRMFSQFIDDQKVINDANTQKWERQENTNTLLANKE